MRIYPYLTFFIPGYYTLRTRHSSTKGVVRFILTYFLPIFLFLVWREYSIVNLLLGFLLVYVLYEVGYIENDCETIKKESNPTLRLKSTEYQLYEKHRISIYTGKIVAAVLIAALLYVRRVNLLICLFSFILIPSYLVYNRIRCKWNLVLHAWLMFVRYYAPILISLGVFFSKDAIAILFVYPVRVMIELSVKGKFGGYENIIVKRFLLHEYSKFQQYRFRYYSFTTLFMLLLLWMKIIDMPIFFIYFYYLMFTIFSMRFPN